MNEHLSEIKVKINEEINHRTYSPLLFCIFAALVAEHYEVVLYLLDSSLTSVEKILKIDSYWESGQSIYKALLSGSLVFLAWCFLHPISALLWDLIKRTIIWVRKTKIHKIPVIPESDYEALEDEYSAERKRLNLEHSDMAVKVESIKSQLENSKNETQRNKEEIARIKDQYSNEKERLIKSYKDEASRLDKSLNNEIEKQKNLTVNAENALTAKLHDSEILKKDFLKFKLEVFDKENWKEDSTSFQDAGFRWRIAFDYFSPAVEDQLVSFFSKENIQLQKNMSTDFSFVWVRSNKEDPQQKLYKKGIEFVSIRDLQSIT